MCELGAGTLGALERYSAGTLEDSGLAVVPHKRAAASKEGLPFLSISARLPPRVPEACFQDLAPEKGLDGGRSRSFELVPRTNVLMVAG